MKKYVFYRTGNVPLLATATCVTWGDNNSDERREGQANSLFRRPNGQLFVYVIKHSMNKLVCSKVHFDPDKLSNEQIFLLMGDTLYAERIIKDLGRPRFDELPD